MIHTSSTYQRSEPGDDDHPLKAVVKMTDDVCKGKTWQTRQSGCPSGVTVILLLWEWSSTPVAHSSSEELTTKCNCLALGPGCPNSVSQG